MATETPPAKLVEFYNTISSSELSELLSRPDVLDPRLHARSGPPTGCMLQSSFPDIGHLQDNYHELQEALYDFRGGYCVMCHLPPERRHLDKKHAHSCQGSGVSSAKEIPGLLVYPALLREPLVRKKLTDDVLLNPEYEFLRVKQDLLGLKGQNHALPDSVASLLGSVLDLGSKTACLQLASSKECPSLRKDEGPGDRLLHVPLGCDYILVLGLDQKDMGLLTQENSSNKPEQTDSPSSAKRSWRELIVDSDDERYDGPKAKRKRPQNRQDSSEATEASAKHMCTMEGHASVKPDPGQIAILLRAGDVVTMTGPARRAWCSIAKVIPGTWPAWEQDWPCWGEVTAAHHELQDFKGCMNGMAVDLVIH